MPVRLGVTAALLLVAASGGVARAADHPVTASNFDFTPPMLTITQGDRVIWTNSGGTHNVQFTTGPAFEMPANPSASWGGTVERVFDTPGTFQYVCRQHAPAMAGTIVVNPSSGPAPPPGTPPPSPPPPATPDPGPGPGGPAPDLEPLAITLKVSDRTPLAGARVRLAGEVRPARDGRKVQIQRRGRGGAYRTIATTRLKDAGAAKSRFSLTLRLQGDAVLRARVAGDAERATGVSRTMALDVHRRRR